MSRRLDQVASELQHNVSAIIRREVEFGPGVVVSVTRLVLGPDFKFVRIFISVLPEAAAAAALKELKNNRVVIQQRLARELTMKFSPRISFALDETESQAARIEGLIDSLS